MKLVTIQTFQAFQQLIQKGYLETESKYINLEKYQFIYGWVNQKMKESLSGKSSEYPLWAWQKYGKISCPPRHKLLGYFQDGEDIIVKITFEKKETEVLLTDFKSFHFVIANQYLPKSKEDDEWFKALQQEKGVTDQDLTAYIRRDKFLTYRTDPDFLELHQMVRKSFDQVLELKSDIVQATFWRLNVSEVRKVEFIRREDCVTRNYSRTDYRKEYLKNL